MYTIDYYFQTGCEEPKSKAASMLTQAVNNKPQIGVSDNGRAPCCQQPIDTKAYAIVRQWRPSIDLKKITLNEPKLIGD